MIDNRRVAGNPRLVITLGLILLLIGLLANIGILYTIGIVLVIVGLVLLLMGRAERGIGGRAHYW